MDIGSLGRGVAYFYELLLEYFVCVYSFLSKEQRECMHVPLKEILS